jgi:peptide/nickel transport system ATP-binding protein
MNIQSIDIYWVKLGCRFHPRCPFAFDRCRVERPLPRAVGAGHEAACHLY